MSNASWPRIASALAECLRVGALAAIVVVASDRPSTAGAMPSVRDLLARYLSAMSDDGALDIVHAETSGTLEGAGLTGTFHVWSQGDDERTDQILGPRVDRTLRLGDRLYAQDSNGNVRRLTGLLARRDRTESFIDSGAFAKSPSHVVSRGIADIDGRRAYALDVTADGGEPETVYLDSATGLPDRVAYDDDDGRTTVDFSDWRTIEGHRFPFRSVESDGDHGFDTTQTVERVVLDLPIDPAVFSPLVQRRIDMAAPDTLKLTWSAGHLYAPVTIAGHPFTFLIDTGAQDILIDRRVVAVLGLHPVGALEASGASRTGGLQVVQLPEVDVGAGRLRDLVVTTIDLGASTAGAFHIDGILGYPFFAQTIARIDVAARTMTFGPPGAIVPEGDRIALELDRSFPEARFRLDANVTAPFVIDTGNAAELLLYRPFVERHPGIVPFTSSQRRSFGIGGGTESYRTALEELDVGATPLYHVDTDVMLATSGAFADRFDAGNIGLGVLANFVVTFDYPNAEMYVEPGPTFDDGRLRV
jgi:predicted aspartyl protease